jgi:hypothetical protein
MSVPSHAMRKRVHLVHKDTMMIAQEKQILNGLSK